ncbi:uncharacterized protein F4822DRAFT_445815 [Hypoxylon trugodes]|uniref:uncharacterized protein n=1 Tax=Hypoxylon trugodes TaxID=326681 RepID=UPI00219E2118|nr:uncharacterized protein F4822DRAFT_445815 [Hypoxylon trugodes]KAI1386030.1 hypothetical protein F4822DRAFT_445815 [Hypoxylon trugodes]
MSWSQNGVYWRRPLDCHDKMFQSIANAGKPLGREHWLLLGVVRLSFPPSINKAETRLRDAWKSLRLRHPDIATELHTDEKRYTPPRNIEVLEMWATDTFHVESAVSSADELFSRHLRVAGDTATCHWVPESRELAIVSSHWRCDGRGMMMTLHEYLLGLMPNDQQPKLPSFGCEVNGLAPSLDVLMNVPGDKNAEWLRKADDLIAPWHEGPPSIGLPAMKGIYPGDTRRIEVRVSRNDTKSLLESCRARRIRLTAALFASVVMETAHHQEPHVAATTKYKSWASFDLRKYCPETPHGLPHAHSLRMLALPLVVDANTDWPSLATSMQSLNSQSFAPGDSDLMFVRVPYVEKVTKMLEKAIPTTEPNLSNLGVMDNYVQTQYGVIKVDNPWIAVQMLSSQLWLHSWSWNGELHISSCYNEAFYEADFVRKWLEGLVSNLLMNLEIKRQIG